MDEEPMFSFTPAAINKLDYLLDLPFASFGGELQYETIEEKAAVLFYHATKDHLFSNGNKRTAVILTMIFLYINGKWLTLSPDEMYELSLKIASSDPRQEGAQFAELLDIFQKRIVDADK